MSPSTKPGQVGTEFAKLVKWIPPLVPWWRENGCDCKIWRDQMDKNGIEWCERNAHYLAKKICKGVRRAGLWTPMMKTTVKLLIDQAIWRARNPRLRYDAMRRKRQNQGV